jgi:GTP-binding protein HflX
LLNTLTDAGVLAEDRLFATLDPRARRLHLPEGRPLVLTDTVGFIRDMPKDLFAAFRATFEEAADADLLLEVVDASDPACSEHMRTTEGILAALGLAELPRLPVYNKVDRLAPAERAHLESRPGSVAISARSKATVQSLLAQLSRHFATEPEPIRHLDADGDYSPVPAF